MNIKYLFAAMAFLGAATLASAQVFEENMGKLNANMSASDYYEEGGFANNKQFVFEGDAEVQYTGATPKNADYTTLVGNSASRGCNVRIGDSYGTYFQISGINTMGMKKPVVGFALLQGVRRFDGTDLVVEYSKDGVGWTALDFEPLSTEEGSQLTFTYRVTSKLPNAENLSIRFRQNGNACVFRIDDVCVAPKNYKK
jgi:hypothetical protein